MTKCRQILFLRINSLKIDMVLVHVLGNSTRNADIGEPIIIQKQIWLCSDWKISAEENCWALTQQLVIHHIGPQRPQTKGDCVV